jgi:hypothetical protein
VALALLAAAARPCPANETDQFSMPADVEFADMGPYLTSVHVHLLTQVVDNFNAEIDKALAIEDPKARQRRLDELHDPGLLADAVQLPFGPGFFEMMDIDAVLHSKQFEKHYPGKKTAWRSWNWIYADTHLPFDPRKIVLAFRSSTIKVYGVFLGTDKMGHFHDLGHFYYKDYLAARNKGLDEQAAVKHVLSIWAYGPVSEIGLIGGMATGVRSNADLAVNYVGFKFFRNLLEPQVLNGVERPPLLLRDGDHYRLNDHVRHGTDFFQWYISEHWNEALNPCDYEWGMRDPIAKRLRKNADSILKLYADDEGRPRPRQWFVDMMHETSTYYGENYGHTGFDGLVVTIARHCFPPEAAASAGTQVQAAGMGE